MALGRCLAEHREQNGLSQQAFAERVHYDRTSISKLETGTQTAPRAFWCAADKLLGADEQLVARFDALTAGQARTRAANVLAEALTAAMLPVAQTSDRVRPTSANPDQVDAVIELEALTRVLAEHNRRVLMGEPADWAEIAERLSRATTTSRRQVEIGVAGGC